MAKLGILGVTLKNSDYVETWAVNPKTALVTDQDIGKAVTLDPSLPESMKLAGAGDSIDGFLETVEVGTHNGQAVGTVLRPGMGARKYVTSADTLVIGDYITGAAQAAAGTAEAKYNYAKSGIGVNHNIAVVAKATGATRWRVVQVSNATDKIYLVEGV